MVSILLSGAGGKMGQVITRSVCERSDCRIAAGIDIHPLDCGYPIFSAPDQCDVPCDVIIDFSHPSVTMPLLAYAVKNHIPAVIATTGLSPEQIEAIHQAAKEIPVFFSANMSLGVSLLTELAKKAAKVLGNDFDIEIVEKHHNRKVDAPSGTALMLADAISEELEQALRESRFPGLKAVREGDRFRIEIPAGLRTTHEMHFAAVRDEFLAMVDGGAEPANSRANLLTKYATLAAARDAARR